MTQEERCEEAMKLATEAELKMLKKHREKYPYDKIVEAVTKNGEDLDDYLL